jgi:uncharacterized protein (TIGR02444 family)
MADSPDWPPNPFWDFSIALYRRPGVAEACIRLQETLGIDVNVLLYLAWLGVERGRALSADDVAAAVARARDWHDGLVRPLRGLRAVLKEDRKGAPSILAERLRNQIKSAELNAERIEQQMLYESRPGDSAAAGARDVARRNIAAYFGCLKISVESADWGAVDVIVNATNL